MPRQAEFTLQPPQLTPLIAAFAAGTRRVTRASRKTFCSPSIGQDGARCTHAQQSQTSYLKFWWELGPRIDLSYLDVQQQGMI